MSVLAAHTSARAPAWAWAWQAGRQATAASRAAQAEPSCQCSLSMRSRPAAARLPPRPPADVSNVVVTPAQRGRGLGRALVAAAAALAADTWAVRRLYCHVEVDNEVGGWSPAPVEAAAGGWLRTRSAAAADTGGGRWRAGLAHTRAAPAVCPSSRRLCAGGAAALHQLRVRPAGRAHGACGGGLGAAPAAVQRLLRGALRGRGRLSGCRGSGLTRADGAGLAEQSRDALPAPLFKRLLKWHVERSTGGERVAWRAGLVRDGSGAISGGWVDA